MKKRVCSLMLIFCMMVGMMLSVGAAGTPSDWAAAEVKTAIAEGLTTDKVTKDYQKNITREEFCELVVILYQKLTGKTATANEDPFTDTDNTEILKAYALGIVNGVSQTEFAPNNTITRQEMCVMIVRAIEAILGEEFILKYDFVNFADNREIASWAFEQIYYAYEKGIVKGVGDNKVAPLGTATCEQAVIMLFRLYENIDNCKDVIPQKVIDRYENYTYVNETFKEIEKKYTDENGYVIPGKVLDLLKEVYASSQEMLENGDIQGAQLNENLLNVCVVLKDGTPYIYTPAMEGIANAKTNIDVTAINNIHRNNTAASWLESAINAGRVEIQSIPQKILDLWRQNFFGIAEQTAENIKEFRYISLKNSGKYVEETLHTNSFHYIGENEIGINYLKRYLSTIHTENKQVFLWRGHGSVWDYNIDGKENGKYINTEKDRIYKSATKSTVYHIDTDSSLMNCFLYDDDIKNDRIIFYNDSYALAPQFFDIYLPEVKGGVFISGTCFGISDNYKEGEEKSSHIMSDAFLNKGFDAYIGTTYFVTNIYSDTMLRFISEFLCEYTDDAKIETITVIEALSKAKEICGKVDWEFARIACGIYQYPVAEFFLTSKSDPDFRLIECPTVKSSNIAEYDGVLYTTNRGVPGMEYIPVEPANYQYICGIAFYGNKLYYACKEHGTSDYRSAIYSCNIDGSNHKLIYDSTYDATDFIISNNKLYPGNKRGYFDLTTNAYVDLAHLLPEGCIIKYAYGNNVYYGTYIKSKKTYSVYKLNVVTGESECIKTGISDIYKYREVIPNDGNAYYKEGTYLYRVNKKGAQRVVDLGHGTARLIAVIGDVVYYDYTEGNTVCFSYYNLETNETATIASHVAAGSGRYFGW